MRIASYKHLICIAYLALLPLHVNANQSLLQETQAQNSIRKLYDKLPHKPNDITARIAFISAQFLKKPYLLGALGEGIKGEYDQSPLYRTDAFDCETYVDTVLGVALARDPKHFKACINHVRYRNGEVSFLTRNHFTSLDWNPNNQKQGFVKDITTSVRGQDKQPVAILAKAKIDKAAWYQHLTLATIKLPHASKEEKEKRLHTLQQAGERFPTQLALIPYIPLSALFDDKGNPNDYLFQQIPNGAIVEIVRPNWDLTEQIGTHLNVSHLGFVFWEHGQLIFRNASSIYGAVVDVSFIDYLRKALSSPTIKGINLQIALPQKPSTICNQN